jgi:predicted secreted protein
MPIASSIAIYVITWWLVLFAVLPFGVKNREEASADPSFLVPGTDAGAPQKPLLLKKLIATTLVSVPVAILLQLFIQYVE